MVLQRPYRLKRRFRFHFASSLHFRCFRSVIVMGLGFRRRNVNRQTPFEIVQAVPNCLTFSYFKTMHAGPVQISIQRTNRTKTLLTTIQNSLPTSQPNKR